MADDVNPKYNARAWCPNCEWRGTVEQWKGHLVAAAHCPGCKCITLQPASATIIQTDSTGEDSRG